MYHPKKSLSGFTIIELMLAMSFVAVLLVAIAMTTIEIGHIYTRGLTLREVNQVGRSVSQDIQRSISASMPFDIAPGLQSKYVPSARTGRLCIGRYSYVWNSDTALRDTASSPDIMYSDGTPVYFAKINDPSASWCTMPYPTTVPRADATELLATGDRSLVLHKFSITVPDSAVDSGSGQKLYAISMTIGTNDVNQLTADASSCKPPASGAGNEDYCSVNQFDIVVRAGNKSGEQ